jgi:hypothetical protein
MSVVGRAPRRRESSVEEELYHYDRLPFSGRPSLTGHCGHGWTCSLPRIVGVPRFLANVRGRARLTIQKIFPGVPPTRPKFFWGCGCARGGISMPASVGQSRGGETIPGPCTDGRDRLARRVARAVPTRAPDAATIDLRPCKHIADGLRIPLSATGRRDPAGVQCFRDLV